MQGKVSSLRFSMATYSFEMLFKVIPPCSPASKYHDSGNLPEASVISPNWQPQSGRSGRTSPEMAPSGRRKASEPPTAELVCLERAAGILLLMSRGEAPVKLQFCSQVLLTRLLDLLDRVDQLILVKVRLHIN